MYLDHEEFFNLSVGILEGIVAHEQLQLFSEKVSIDSDTISALLHAAGAVLWEFAKAAPADPSVVAVSLQQVGLPEDLASHFSMVCISFNIDIILFQ